MNIVSKRETSEKSRVVWFCQARFLSPLNNPIARSRQTVVSSRSSYSLSKVKCVCICKSTLSIAVKSIARIPQTFFRIYLEEKGHVFVWLSIATKSIARIS